MLTSEELVKRRMRRRTQSENSGAPPWFDETRPSWLLPRARASPSRSPTPAASHEQHLQKLNRNRRRSSSSQPKQQQQIQQSYSYSWWWQCWRRKWFWLLIVSTIALSALMYSYTKPVSNSRVFIPTVDQLKISSDSEGGDGATGEEGNQQQCNTHGRGNELGLELETASAIHAALEMKSQGKLAKAQKLFNHAIQLCPKHPDLLVHYGEFVESAVGDYIKADQYYLQALTYEPTHTRAMINRKRTSPVVEEADERRLGLIDDKLESLLKIPPQNSALSRVKKEAYFQHLYHTVGLEGNTMSLAQTRMIVETRMAVGGKSLQEHNEILGLDDAMKFINTTLTNRIGSITLDDLLRIHFHVMSYTDPSEAGRLRGTQVYVSNHVPPPPGKELEEGMESLVEWLNSEEAISLHPVHYAAIAHYKLVYLHPFTDGNGRTSRLLMNFILMQAGYPPVIIRKQERHLYYQHLNTANNGDVRPFIRFIADCTEKTIDVYLWATSSSSVTGGGLDYQNHILDGASTDAVIKQIKEEDDNDHDINDNGSDKDFEE